MVTRRWADKQEVEHLTEIEVGKVRETTDGAGADNIPDHEGRMREPRLLGAVTGMQGDPQRHTDTRPLRRMSNMLQKEMRWWASRRVQDYEPVVLSNSVNKRKHVRK